MHDIMRDIQVELLICGERFGLLNFEAAGNI